MTEQPPTVGVSRFAADRHRPEQPYSHYSGPGGWGDVIQMVRANWLSLFNRQGYKPGVRLVRVPADGFLANTIEVTESTPLKAIFTRRREGEQAYVKVLACDCPKSPARRVEIVLYSAEVLDEDDDRSTDCEWEIVSVNASPTDNEEPMHPLTMARNFLHLPGGTKGDYTAEQFAEAIVYWSTKVQGG